MRQLNFVIRIAVCFLFVLLPLNTLDQWFYDHFFHLRGIQRHPSPFILIQVNDAKLYQQHAGPLHPSTESTYRLDSHPRYTWYADYYNALINKLEQGIPKLIIFASFYDEVLPSKDTLPPFSNLLFSATLSRENKLLMPPPTLAVGDNYGFGNIFPDPDNVVRKSHLVYSYATSLALRTQYRVSNDLIKRNLMDPLWIDFQGPEGTYTTYDASDFLEGTLSPHLLDGKIVLVGRKSSPASAYDTPFGRMSPLEIEANTIDTFLGKRDIKICSRAVSLAAATLAVIASILIILFLPLTLAWLFLLLLSSMILLITLLFFAEFKVWTGVANPIFCVFGTHLLMLGYKLSRQEEEQWKIQQESVYLKEMDQFKNNFISLFSHDLKTPIAKIRAITDRLLNSYSDLSADVKESLRAIDRTNSELARSISDILKVTKMESMPLEPEKEVIDLNRLAEVAASRLKFLADEKNIEIVLDLEPLFSMEGDQQLLQEVILNLLENAIKYSRPNRQVVVRTREEEGQVRVSVIDEGEGIPQDEIPRVTGKFYRGRSVIDKVKGSGLGLYLSKYFIELHQGKLEIVSTMGRGTEVKFWLPIHA